MSMTTATRRFARRGAVVTVGALALGALVGIPFASAGTVPTQTLDPSTVEVGGVVTVHGQCTPPFNVEARVVVSTALPGFSTLFVSMNAPDPSTGIFSGSFTIPAGSPVGAYSVQVQCGNGVPDWTSRADLPLAVTAAAPTTTTVPASTTTTVAPAVAAASSPTFTG